MKSDAAARAHLARCYLELAALGARVRSHLEATIPDVGPYPKGRVALRLAQRILEMVHVDYLRGRRDGLFEPDAQDAALAGLRVNLRTGAVRPGRRVWRSVAGFFVRACAYLLLQAPLVFRAAGTQPATLILGLRQSDLLSEGNAREFLAFCAEGRVAPLAAATALVVQDRVAQPHREAHLGVARFGLLEALKRAPRAGLLRFVAAHLAAMVWYVVSAARRPVLALLDRDLAEHALAVRLNEARGLRDVIVTNAWFAEQPLWMTDLPARSFGAHLVCYSMLGRAFRYADSPHSPPHPGFALMRAERFWVWTAGQRALLEELGVEGEAQVCGPIVWRPRRPARGGRDIALFDVTPFNPQVAHRLGLAYYFYTAENCAAFLDDVVTAARTLGAHVLLKHKRAFASSHDRRYAELVASLCGQGVLRTVEPDTNPYALLGSSFAAVVMPFSSPAYIARDAGVPAIYYDPSGLMLPSFEELDGITFVRDRDALVAALQSSRSARPSISR